MRNDVALSAYVHITGGCGNQLHSGAGTITVNPVSMRMMACDIRNMNPVRRITGPLFILQTT